MNLDDPSLEMTALMRRYPALEKASQAEILDVVSALDLGVWSEHKRHYRNAPFHWEWYDMAMEESRLALLAPREHAKSEVFAVNLSAWKSIYVPGHWTFIFSNAGEQAEKILSRAVSAIAQTNPELVERPKVLHSKEVVLSNDSKISVRGSGAAVRGAHPDLIIGDDVQDENNTATQMQRDRLKQWWFGTVGGMAHPGTTRVVAMPHGAETRAFDATRIILVGTPFHALDLLMSARDNEMYKWRLYGAVTNDLPTEDAV